MFFSQVLSFKILIHGLYFILGNTQFGFKLDISVFKMNFQNIVCGSESLKIVFSIQKTHPREVLTQKIKTLLDRYSVRKIIVIGTDEKK